MTLIIDTSFSGCETTCKCGHQNGGCASTTAHPLCVITIRRLTLCIRCYLTSFFFRKTFDHNSWIRPKHASVVCEHLLYVVEPFLTQSLCQTICQLLFCWHPMDSQVFRKRLSNNCCLQTQSLIWKQSPLRAQAIIKAPTVCHTNAGNSMELVGILLGNSLWLQHLAQRPTQKIQRIHGLWTRVCLCRESATNHSLNPSRCHWNICIRCNWALAVSISLFGIAIQCPFWDLCPSVFAKLASWIATTAVSPFLKLIPGRKSSFGLDALVELFGWVLQLLPSHQLSDPSIGQPTGE